MPTVEVLYLPECPHSRDAIDRVRSVVSELGRAPEVQLVLVETVADALRRRFLGSPSVRVDGHDVETVARMRTDFGLQCRMYWDDGRLTGLPPVAWIRDALREAGAR